jgi:cobalamin synthase
MWIVQHHLFTSPSNVHRIIFSAHCFEYSDCIYIIVFLYVFSLPAVYLVVFWLCFLFLCVCMNLCESEFVGS